MSTAIISNEYQTFFNFDHIDKSTQDHLQKVYATLGLGWLSAAVGSLVVVYGYYQFGWLALLGSMACIFYLMFTAPTDQNVIPRMFALLLFGFFTGLGLGPLIIISTEINPQIVPTAILITSGIFFSFSMAALLNKSRSYLYMGGTLMSLLMLLVVMNIANLFFGSLLVWKIELYLGLIVFCLLVLFDTQLIIEKRRMGDTDYICNVCDCTMSFGIYLPEKSLHQKCPVVYWLSGLTCTEQNAITKSGIQHGASKHGLIIVCPDTSPRGDNIPDDPESYDFGKGAGFYLDATKEPWNKNFKMYSYVTKELPSLIESNFPVLADKQGIMGHSMGGHGALVCSLKNPGKYLSVSAFAPVCNPTKCPWGIKAFTSYLGEDSKDDWNQYDCVELIKSGKRFANPILVDQGDCDNFLPAKQLLPDHLEKVCKEHDVALELRMQKGYDHSYYFIATFIDSHLEFHSKILNQKGSGE